MEFGKFGGCFHCVQEMPRLSRVRKERNGHRSLEETEKYFKVTSQVVGMVSSHRTKHI